MNAIRWHISSGGCNWLVCLHTSGFLPYISYIERSEPVSPLPSPWISIGKVPNAQGHGNGVYYKAVHWLYRLNCYIDTPSPSQYTNLKGEPAVRCDGNYGCNEPLAHIPLDTGFALTTKRKWNLHKKYEMYMPNTSPNTRRPNATYIPLTGVGGWRRG